MHTPGRVGFLTEEEASFEQSTLPQVRDLYLEYAEMCIQYGYLVMFAPVFPVCFLLAAANNVQEIRGDLMKIVHLGRRPVPRAAKDIGVWYVFLKLFTFMACFTNAGIITVTIDTWRDASEPDHDDNAVSVKRFIFVYSYLFLISDCLPVLTLCFCFSLRGRSISSPLWRNGCCSSSSRRRCRRCTSCTSTSSRVYRLGYSLRFCGCSTR